MKIRVFEGTAVITTSLDMELVKKAQEVCPEALVASDVDDNDTVVEVFRIGTSGTEHSSLSEFGAVFNKDGKIKLSVPTEDSVAYIKTTFGKALLMLQDFEMHLEDHVAETLSRYDSLDDIITVVE